MLFLFNFLEVVLGDSSGCVLEVSRKFEFLVFMLCGKDLEVFVYF